MRDSTNRQYTSEWLQYERPQPMYDISINKLYDNIFKENPIYNDNIIEDF